jgi:hypothetical protein
LSVQGVGRARKAILKQTKQISPAAEALAKRQVCRLHALKQAERGRNAARAFIARDLDNTL